MSTRTDQSLTDPAEVDVALDNVQLTDGDEVEDDNELALKGIQMLLNNKLEESAAMFEKYRAHSVIMHYGGCFINYMQALTSLEEEKISGARKSLEELEKKCKTHSSLFKKLKKKMKNSNPDGMSQEDKWTSQIIVADVLFYQAVLTFINQDIPSYVKGGWLLRKAWKIFDRVYHDISKHYEEGKTNGKIKVQVDLNHTELLQDADDITAKPTTPVAHDSSSMRNGAAAGAGDDGPTEMMTKETLSRLLGAVSFGYGMFQLGISMLPDKILKLIEFLGFHGDRQIGVKALEFSMKSSDMRAPLAVLSMLWYQILMKPFFTETLSDEELQEATTLVEEHQSIYPSSSIFLFFKGRLWRLRKNLDAALEEYERAKESSANQVELRNAALFEIAWCNMMKLNYSVSYGGFTTLVSESKWSKCFYTYMLSICAGSQGNLSEAADLMKTVPGLVKKKTNQVEAFVSRRAQQFKKIKLTESTAQLLVLELIYMWNSLPQCSQAEVESMLAVCSAVEEKKFFHLRSLIEAAIYKQLGDRQFSEQLFKEAIARHEGLKHDYHVAAHALFELGSYYVQSEDTKAEGKKMLLKAKDGFKEYDFENRLNVRIRNVLKLMDGS